MSKRAEIITSMTILIISLISISMYIYDSLFSISSVNLTANIANASNIEKFKTLNKDIEQIKTDNSNKIKNNDKEVNKNFKINKDKETSNEIKRIINAVLLSNIDNKEIEDKVINKLISLNKKEEDPKKEQEHKNLCENLMFQPNAEELLKKNGCDIHDTNKGILNVKKGNIIEKDKDLNTTVEYNKRKHAVNLWKKRTKIILDKYGNDKDKVLDLLTIMTMECNKDMGNCFNGNDIGPFQINQVHKERYNHSYKLYLAKKWDELFNYQLDKASKLLDSYRKTGCSDYNIEHYGVGKNYEEKRWRCIAFRYNGHPVYKFGYNKLGLKKRKIIENFLKEEGILK